MPRVSRSPRRRLVLAGTALMLLILLDTVLLATALTCVRQQHVLVRMFGRHAIHAVVLRPAPVYAPSHVDPASIRRPLLLVAWYEDQQVQMAGASLRVQLDSVAGSCIFSGFR